MAQIVSIIPLPEDRSRLTAVIADRNAPHKHVQRAHIILYSAEWRPVLDIARRSGISRPAVWRWQQRFVEQDVESLLRAKTRKRGNLHCR